MRCGNFLLLIVQLLSFLTLPLCELSDSQTADFSDNTNLSQAQHLPVQQSRMVPDKEDDEVLAASNGKQDKKRIVNFASIAAGAVVLESPEKASGYKNLLNEDKDKYGISPCSEKKWVVIGLSEDIMDFQVLGSTSYPVSEWLDLGTYTSEPRLGDQEFDITNPAWARYLKFRFLSHFGEEFYCTLSQIRVHGSTMLENFKQEVERSDEEVRYMHSALLTDSDTGSESNLDVEKGSAILESGQTGDDGPVELALTTSGDPSLIPISAVGNNEILLDTSKNADARTKAENTAPTLTDESSISDVTALDKSTSESSYSETCEDSGAAAEVGLDVDISDSMVDLSLLRRSENSFPESKTSDFSGLELPDGGTPPTLSSLERSTQGEGTETEAAAHLSFDGIINRIDSVKLDSTSELLGVDLFQESTSGESTQTPTHTTPVSDDEGQKENKNSTKVCRLAANIMGDVEKVCMSIPATTASAVTEIKPDYPTVAKVSEDISVSIQDLDHRLEEAAPLPGSGFVSEPALEKSNASNSAEVLNSPDTNGRNVTEDIIMKAIIGSTHAVCSNEGRRANITTDMSTSETSASAGSCSHIDPTIAPGTGAAVYDAPSLPLASVSSSPPDSQLNVSGGDVHGDIEEPESSDADGLKIQLEISEDIEKTIESGEYAQTNENELVVDVSNSIVSNISRNNNKNNSTLILSPGVIPAENETIEDHDDEIVTSSSIINDLEKISLGIASQLQSLPLNSGSEKLILSARSRDCYDGLKFLDFQAKMRAKLQASADTERAMGPQDNVFRALMQRIKSLEMNNGIIEMYISQMSDCYRAVLNDMIAAGNTSAVALALMVNSREGGGIAKALNTDTVQSSRASFARADEELESASRLVQSLTIDIYYLYIVIGVIFVLMGTALFAGAGFVYFYLQPRILQLERRHSAEGQCEVGTIRNEEVGVSVSLVESNDEILRTKPQQSQQVYRRTRVPRS